MSKQSATAVDSDEPVELSNPTLRSAISLALVIHFICLSACFFSVFPTSPFDAKLLGVLAPYLQSMNFDLDQTPYYLTLDPINENTQSFFDERTYRLEVLLQGNEDSDENWLSVSEQAAGWNGPHRFQRWATTASMFTDQEEFSAEIAQGIARYFKTNMNAKVAKIRIRLQQPLTQRDFRDHLSNSPDPNSNFQFQTLYTAIILHGDDGELSVIRESSLRESAPPNAT